MKHTSKSSLFLMELIIAILFFSVSSAICVQLFVTAHLKSESSVNLNLAVLQAETVAEQYKAGKGEIFALTKAVNAKKTQGGTYICYYDTDGNFDSKEFCDFEIRIEENKEKELNGIEICVYKINEAEKKPIYSLMVNCYKPKKLT
ncbi:MAG: hypothetical protein RR902_06225 [Oscillospiraceae bacterium]